MIIRPPIRRVIEIVGTRIKRELVERIGVEPGRRQNFAIRRPQNCQRLFDHLTVLTNRHTCAGDIQRHRPDTLMLIRLVFMILQNREWPIADKIIQLRQSLFDDPLRLFPGPPDGQHAFRNSSDRQWTEQRRVALVNQQIAMMLPVRRRNKFESQTQNRFRLRGVLKRVISPSQLRQFCR